MLSALKASAAEKRSLRPDMDPAELLSIKTFIVEQQQQQQAQQPTEPSPDNSSPQKQVQELKFQQPFLVINITCQRNAQSRCYLTPCSLWFLPIVHCQYNRLWPETSWAQILRDGSFEVGKSSSLVFKCRPLTKLHLISDLLENS